MINNVLIKPTRIILNGDIKAQKEYRKSFSAELCKFLREHKYEYIKTDTLRDFYAQKFPGLNLTVENERPKFPLVGFAEQNYNVKSLEMTDSNIKIASNSFEDKIKGLFGIKSHKDEFFVDSKFAEVVIHESTHSLQHFMKQTHSVYLKELNKIFGGDRECLVSMVGLRDAIYKGLVYKGGLLPTEKESFRKNLMNDLNKTKLGEDRIALANLKSMIRDAENELEAYTLGKTQSELFMFPELENNTEYKRYLDRNSVDRTNIGFDFSEKLSVMKEEFFKLVNKIRKEQQN